MQGEKLKIICALSRSIAKIILRCTVSKTSKYLGNFLFWTRPNCYSEYSRALRLSRNQNNKNRNEMNESTVLIVTHE